MADFGRFYQDLLLSEGAFFLENSLDALLDTPIPPDKQQEIFKIFTSKALDLFKKGEVLGIKYLYLGLLIPDMIALDMDFERYFSLAQQAMQASSNPIETRMFFELACISKLMSGAKLEALHFLTEQLCLQDSAFLCHYNALIIDLFTKLKVPFSVPKCVFDKLLNPAHFLALHPKTQRNILNAQLHLFWNVPHYFASKEWLGLYETYKVLFVALLEANALDSVLFLQFLIYHVCGNAFSDGAQWEDFNTHITLIASKHYPRLFQQYCTTHAKSYPCYLEHSTPIVIGILRDRLVENSPFKVECSLIAMLTKHPTFNTRFKIKVFSMDYDEKSPNDPQAIALLQNLGEWAGFEGGIELITLPTGDAFYQSHLEKALMLKELFYTHQVRILISPNNGYGISDFLLATRSGVVQIYYSHGNKAYHLDTLEGYMTHIAPTIGAYSQSNLPYLGIFVPMLSFFYNPPLDAYSQHLVQKTRSFYVSDPDMLILGTIGRLTKLDSLEFLHSVLEILHQAPQSVYLACGIGSSHAIQEKLEQLIKEHSLPPSLLGRFKFVGYVDAHLYGHVIDLFLDTFPMQQGESKAEFSAKNKLVLTLSESMPQARQENFNAFVSAHMHALKELCSVHAISLEDYQRYYHQEAQSVIALSPKDYVSKALALLKLWQNPKQLKTLLEERSILRAITHKLKAEQSVDLVVKYLDQLLG
ncbi:hypothetical protein [Helicobacter bizzozeronii]|uniref:hypothetical protein n=1 Tax=Helicobacter bizzozeronii TaxID=56877 RepID=UPI000CF019BA|nr:hypothetical protein [Helicobacter bizzozeronii]